MRSLLLLLSLLALPATAHTGGTLSSGHWESGAEGPNLRLQLRPQDLRNLPAELIQDDLEAFLREGTRVQSAAGPCIAPATEPRPLEQGKWLFEWSFACPAEAVTAEYQWLHALPGHLHVAWQGTQVQLLRGGQERRLKLNAQAAGVWTSLRAEFRYGLEHIATGWDHLAFLLGLLLIAHSLGGLVALVTGFTLGHSSSLLLATQARVLPPSDAVELTIAASIVLVGLPTRGLWAPRLSPFLAWALVVGLAAWALPSHALLWVGLLLLGWAHGHFRSQANTEAAWAALLLSAVFGLLHGFGFAGAIIEHAQEASGSWPVLLGFNLGVEAGQLLFLLPAWWLLRGLRSRPWSESLIQAAVCGLGMYWFTSRLL